MAAGKTVSRCELVGRTRMQKKEHDVEGEHASAVCYAPRAGLCAELAAPVRSSRQTAPS